MPRKSKLRKKLTSKRVKAGLKRGTKIAIKTGFVDPFKSGLKVAKVLVPGVALIPTVKTRKKSKKK